LALPGMNPLRDRALIVITQSVRGARIDSGGYGRRKGVTIADRCSFDDWTKETAGLQELRGGLTCRG